MGFGLVPRRVKVTAVQRGCSSSPDEKKRAEAAQCLRASLTVLKKP